MRLVDVALVPVGDSEVTGIAILDEDNAGMLDLGDDWTRVTVYTVTRGDDEAIPVA